MSSRHYQPIYATNRVMERRPGGWACWRCGADVPGSTGHLVYGAPCQDCRELLRAEGDRTVWDARQIAKGITEIPEHACPFDDEIVALFDAISPGKPPRRLTHCERLAVIPKLLRTGHDVPQIAKLLNADRRTIERNIEMLDERIPA